MIKNLPSKLIQNGNIKIGCLGEKRKSNKPGGNDWQLPQKLDHFIITRLEKGPDGNFIKNTALMEMLKNSGSKVDKNGNLISIPISLLYNDPELNLHASLAMYTGKRCACRGDGETATQFEFRKEGKSIKKCEKQIACPCENLESRKCKPSGKLTCVIRGIDQIGACYVFRTTSWNTIACLMGSFNIFYAQTNGLLAGLPFELVIRPYTVETDGGPSKIQVVSMIFAGSDYELQQLALEKFRNNRNFIAEMKRIEHKAKQIEYVETDEEQEDFQNEFHPDAGLRGDEEKVMDAPDLSKGNVLTPDDAERLRDTGIRGAEAGASLREKVMNGNAPDRAPLICGWEDCKFFDVSEKTFCNGGLNDISTCTIGYKSITFREAFRIAKKTRGPEIKNILKKMGLDGEKEFTDDEVNDVFDYLMDGDGK